jgi:DNA processing protein
MTTLSSCPTAWRIWLSHIGTTPKKQRAIIPSLLINPESAKTHLTQTSDSRITSPNWSQVEKVFAWVQQKKVTLVTDLCDNYPQQLKDDDEHPVILFAKGNLSLLHTPQAAVVGSRNASLYGLQQCQEITQRQATLGWTITSGLALGIDGMAHRTALAQQKPTIAVLGVSLDTIYPREHSHLYHHLLEQGLIISEVLPQTPYRRYAFPWRNRIVSGLSHHVIIVEAQEKSGALHTATHALKQNREIYALPGRIDQKQAHGTNRLIQQGAHIITHLDDLPTIPSHL